MLLCAGDACCRKSAACIAGIRLRASCSSTFPDRSISSSSMSSKDFVLSARCVVPEWFAWVFASPAPAFAVSPALLASFAPNPSLLFAALALELFAFVAVFSGVSAGSSPSVSSSSNSTIIFPSSAERLDSASDSGSPFAVAAVAAVALHALSGSRVAFLPFLLDWVEAWDPRSEHEMWRFLAACVKEEEPVLVEFAGSGGMAVNLYFWAMVNHALQARKLLKRLAMRTGVENAFPAQNAAFLCRANASMASLLFPS